MHDGVQMCWRNPPPTSLLLHEEEDGMLAFLLEHLYCIVANVFITWSVKNGLT